VPLVGGFSEVNFGIDLLTDFRSGPPDTFGDSHSFCGKLCGKEIVFTSM